MDFIVVTAVIFCYTNSYCARKCELLENNKPKTGNFLILMTKKRVPPNKTVLYVNFIRIIDFNATAQSRFWLLVRLQNKTFPGNFFARAGVWLLLVHTTCKTVAFLFMKKKKIWRRLHTRACITLCYGWKII